MGVAWACCSEPSGSAVSPDCYRMLFEYFSDNFSMQFPREGGAPDLYWGCILRKRAWLLAKKVVADLYFRLG